MTETNPTPVKTSPAKAVWGAIVAGVIAIATALQVAISSGADLSQPLVWINVILAGVVAAGGTGGAVYGVTNKPIS